MQKVFAMFTVWANDTYQNKIQPVLQKFAVYYQPLKNVPFERYKFYSRMQESGESYDHYQTALRQLVERCKFESITPNQILRDKLMFGIRDSKFVRGFFMRRIHRWKKLMRFVVLMRPWYSR